MVNLFAWRKSHVAMASGGSRGDEEDEEEPFLNNDDEEKGGGSGDGATGTNRSSGDTKKR